MTLPGNGTTKRILATLVAAIVIFLAGAVLSNSNRITAVEAKLENIIKVGDKTLDQMEKNRDENYKEHKEILAEIRGVKK